jgi:hypothetical protein
MNAGTGELSLSLLSPYQAEMQILRTGHPNVMIEGTVADTDDVLLLLQPYLAQPITWKRPGAPLVLAGEEPRVLILEQVTTLSAEDQSRLIEWLDHRRVRIQVVSTTERPLFELVSRGLFDAALYYRLNVILLNVGSRDELRS